MLRKNISYLQLHKTAGDCNSIITFPALIHAISQSSTIVSLLDCEQVSSLPCAWPPVAPCPCPGPAWGPPAQHPSPFPDLVQAFHETWGSQPNLFPASALLWGWESDFWQQVMSNVAPPRTFLFVIFGLVDDGVLIVSAQLQQTGLDKTSHSILCEISHAQFIMLFLCTAGFSADFPPCPGIMRSSRLVKGHKILILKCRDVPQPSHLYNSPPCPKGTAEQGVDRSYPRGDQLLFLASIFNRESRSLT